MRSASTWARGGLVGLVVLAGLLTDRLSASGEVQSLDPGTPEAEVQTYLQAVLRGDAESASELLVSDSDCDSRDVEQAYADPDAYVVLREVGADASTAHVDVSVTSGSTALVPTTWTEDHSLRLVREADGWRLTGSPWPMFDCRMELP